MKDYSTFSYKDINLLCNREFINQKNLLLLKIEAQLNRLGEHSIKHYPTLNNSFRSFKVSKGENKEGYPFRILDYPRDFQIRQIFAIRTLVWWGNNISCTLHLKGSYLEEAKRYILQHLPFALKELKFSNSGNEWEVNSQKAKFKPIEQLNEHELNKSTFLRISSNLALTNLNELETFHIKMVSELLRFTPYATT